MTGGSFVTNPKGDEVKWSQGPTEVGTSDPQLIYVKSDCENP